MPFSRSRYFRITLIFLLLRGSALEAQQSNALHPPDYPGVRTIIPGVFITPVAGAPFSGTVEILSKQSMPDGTVYTRRTINHIARNSSGVIYNERRKLVPPSFQGEPPILTSHIYDPQTRLSTFLSPETLVARQMVLSTPRRPLRTALPLPWLLSRRRRTLQLKTLELKPSRV